MTAAVTRQKGHALFGERANDKGIRGLAEGSLNLDLVDIRQLRHLIEPAAADDADFCPGHPNIFPNRLEAGYRAPIGLNLIPGLDGGLVRHPITSAFTSYAS